MMLYKFLRGAICVAILLSVQVLAQQYADAQTLAMLRQSIDQVRQQTAQLRGMGADAATLQMLDANLRYLELQYASLNGTGPAPGSPQMIAAERAYLEAQFRQLQSQRQQMVQLGVDRATLASFDESMATLRQQINALGNGTATSNIAPPPIPAPSSSDPWAGYNPVGPNGQNCTPYYEPTLNRKLVPAGCPMPGAGQTPSKPQEGTYVVPPAGNYGLSGQPTPSRPTATRPAPPSRTSVPNTVTAPPPTFSGAGTYTPPMTPSSPTPTLSAPPLPQAQIDVDCAEAYRNKVYAKIPDECLPKGKKGKGKGKANGSGGDDKEPNWGQRDARPPSIESQRSKTSKYEQQTVITRYDIKLGKCKTKEVRVEYKSNGFLGDAQSRGTVSWTGGKGCVPDANARLYIRLTVGEAVGWVELEPNWTKGSAEFGVLAKSDQAVVKMQGRKVVGYWEKAMALRFFSEGVFSGFLVIEPGS